MHICLLHLELSLNTEFHRSPITQDILILENGKALGEIKANENEKGLRTESLILGKGKNAIIVPNVVSVNNINTQLDKYISPKQKKCT